MATRSMGGGISKRVGGDTPESAVAAKELIDTVKATVAPDTWAPGGSAQIREANGELFVRQTEENQAAVARLLDQLAETRSIQISIGTRLFVVSADEYQAIAPQEWDLEMATGNPPAPLAPARIIDAYALGKILTRLDADKSVVQYSAPRVTVLNGGAARFRYGTVAKEKKDDVGSAMLKGAPEAIRATASADRRYLVCQIRLDVPALAATTEPAAEARIVSIGAQPGTTTLVSIPNGGTLLIALGQGRTSSGEVRYVIEMLRPGLVLRSEPETRPSRIIR